MIFNFDALWEYQAADNEVPADPFAVVVPPLDWLGPSNAPFGTAGPSYVTDLTAGTVWAVGEALWVRRAMTVDGLAPVLLRGRVNSAAFVYVDDTFVGAYNPTNASLDGVPEIQIVIPQELLPAGNRTIAVLLLDETAGVGDTTWFWLEADYLPPVMSFWAAPGFNEAIAWLNDVTIYEDGGEDRERLRNAPRHTYRMSCFVPMAYQAMVRNQLYGARAKQWIVPIWPQMQHVGAVLADDLTLDALTSFSEYADGALLILWESPTSWQVIGIDQVLDDNTISLTTKTKAFSDAWVAPVHKAYMANDPGRAFDGRTSRLSLMMNVEDNRVIVPAAPAQYLGNDIYFDEGLLEGDKSDESVTAGFVLMDEQLGLVDYHNTWLNNRPSRQHRMMGGDQEEAWGIREWLHRRAGRLTPFWHPSFEVDFRVLNTGAVTTSITVAEDEYRRWAAGRDHIAIELTSGWQARAVTSVTNLGGGQIRLNFTGSLATTASAIKRVCYLGLRRLNSDRVEVSYPGGTVCACAVPVLDIEP